MGTMTAVSRVRAVEREAVERNGWRRGKAGKEKEGSHEWRQPGEGNRADRSREKRCVRKSEMEQRWLAECVREREKRGPVEFRARYAIWRYRGQRLVRNTKLFMNGRKLSLKL